MKRDRKAWSAAYYQKNKEKIKARVAVWAKKNTTKVRTALENWHARNPDKRAIYSKRTRMKCAEQHKEYRKKYYQTHKPQHFANAALRRARKLGATPKWLTSEQHDEIRQIYRMAQLKSLLTQQEFHVDHIYPLVGKMSCGLHVPWNLQILPASENLRKHNKVLI